MANLTQLKILEDLDGFLLVDKPVGIPFTTVVKTVKRKFNLVKVGHGGSLDAAASGLLVLLLGDANKFVGDVMGADREYEGEMRFGGTTNTGDANGVPCDQPHPLAVEELRGDIFQTEPRFAAIRREGTAGYEIVDTGEHEQFLAHVYRFEFEDTRFRLRATKGVIPRALAFDLGATLVSLRRTRIGKFKLERAIPFDRLLDGEMKDLPSWVMSIGEALR